MEIKLILTSSESSKRCFWHPQFLSFGFGSQTTVVNFCVGQLDYRILEYFSVQHCLKPKLFYNFTVCVFFLCHEKSGNARLTALTSQACQASQAGNLRSAYFDHCRSKQCNFLTNADINLGPFNYYVIHHGEEGWGYVKI